MTRPRARAFRSHCQRHRKRESQPDVNGCDAAHIRLRSPRHSVRQYHSRAKGSASENQIDAAFCLMLVRRIDEHIASHVVLRLEVTQAYRLVKRAWRKSAPGRYDSGFLITD